MNKRAIANIFSPTPPHFVGDGFKVHNFIPAATGNMQRMSPFIMLDYNALHHFPPAEKPRGVGVHPHRGFETVTIAYKGKIAHHDSGGGGGVIGEGDVQWMTAGAGVLHKEYHEETYSKTGGPFQMVQLWVNLPAAHKMTSPAYQSIQKSQLGVFYLPNDLGSVEVIAGEYEGVKGPAHTFTPVHLYNVRLNAGGQLEIPFPESWNVAVLAIEGDVQVNDKTLNTNHFAVMEPTGNSFELSADAPALALVLAGAPINEPIAAYGPFVMNTQAEIQQAIRDYQSGKFGDLSD